MDYKDRSKKEAVWDKFCEEDNTEQRCLPKMVSEPVHTLWKGHSHEVGPG